MFVLLNILLVLRIEIIDLSVLVMMVGIIASLMVVTLLLIVYHKHEINKRMDELRKTRTTD